MPSKKERHREKEAKRVAEMQLKSQKSREDTIKWVTIGVVSALFLGLFGFLIYNGKANNQTSDNDVPVQFSDVAHVIEPSVSTSSATPNSDTAASGEEADASEVVEVVEFVDLQCPTCQAYHPVVKEVIAQNPDTVRFVFKHFPLSIHQHARRAAIAAEAAGEQGQFFEMVDLLFENQQAWSEEANPSETFLGYAQQLELDIEQFRADLENEELAERVEQNVNEGMSVGVGGTPTFFINGKATDGLPPRGVDGFQAIIDAELNE